MVHNHNGHPKFYMKCTLSITNTGSYFLMIWAATKYLNFDLSLFSVYGVKVKTSNDGKIQLQ